MLYVLQIISIPHSSSVSVVFSLLGDSQSLQDECTVIQGLGIVYTAAKKACECFLRVCALVRFLNQK